jgi:hypothetical protein
MDIEKRLSEKMQFTVMAPIFEIFTLNTLQNVGNSDLQKFWSERDAFTRYRRWKIAKTQKMSIYFITKKRL